MANNKKITLNEALNLYEEDIEIRNDLKALDAPERDPHWEDWYKYGLSIEPPIEDKIAVDQTSSSFTSNVISKVIFVKDTTRRNRIHMTDRAKTRRLKKAKIVMDNYDKRDKDATHRTSVINGEKVCMHSHFLVRADKLIKDADKLSEGKLFKDTIKFLKRALELQKMGYFGLSICHIQKAIELQTAKKLEETDKLFEKAIGLIEKAINLQNSKKVEEANQLLEKTILLIENVIDLLRAKKVEKAIELIEDALKLQEEEESEKVIELIEDASKLQEEESEKAIELQKAKKSSYFRKPMSLRK